LFSKMKMLEMDLMERLIKDILHVVKLTRSKLGHLLKFCALTTLKSLVKHLKKTRNF
jgi:hypothetical protein